MRTLIAITIMNGLFCANNLSSHPDHAESMWYGVSFGFVLALLISLSMLVWEGAA